MIFRYVCTGLLVLKLAWEGRSSPAVGDARQSGRNCRNSPDIAGGKQAECNLMSFGASCNPRLTGMVRVVNGFP